MNAHQRRKLRREVQRRVDDVLGHDPTRDRGDDLDALYRRADQKVTDSWAHVWPASRKGKHLRHVRGVLRRRYFWRGRTSFGHPLRGAGMGCSWGSAPKPPQTRPTRRQLNKEKRNGAL